MSERSTRARAACCCVGANAQHQPAAPARPLRSAPAVTCQHGPTECLYNTLEACAIHHYPTNGQFVPFVVCLSAAAQGSGGLSTAKAQKCAANSKLAWAVLNTCWTGAEGRALDDAAAAKTAALNPPHQYVPWVTLDAPGTFCTENGCDDFIAQASGAAGRNGAHEAASAFVRDARANERARAATRPALTALAPLFPASPQVCKAYTGTKPPACA